jgi:beta-hydroxylase
MSTDNLIHFVESSFSSYRTCALFESDEFTVSRELRNLYPTLINEYTEYTKRNAPRPIQQLSEVQRDLTGDQNSWKAVFLYGYRQQLAPYHGFFEQTLKFVKGHSKVVNAFFSVLEPGTRLPIHTGKYSGLLRAQLCLMTPPSGDFGLEVDGRLVDVPLGEVRVFDDTYPHCAWNMTETPRVVFIVDFMRPLPFHLHMLNRVGLWLIGRSEYVKGIKRNLN